MSHNFSIRQLFWPKFCLHCQQTLWSNPNYLCPNCTEKIILNGQIWQQTTPLNVLGKTYLDGYEIMAKFDGVMATLIKSLKYQQIQELGLILGQWLWLWCKIPWKIDAVCHVPLHRKRYLSRGFNQARELAVAVSKLSGWPHYSVLTRTRHTLNQAATANIQQRQNQLHQIFTIRPEFLTFPSPPPTNITSFSSHHISAPTSLKNLNWLIIDDVLTTGNTLNECARTLKKELFATAVYGLVIAKK